MADFNALQAIINAYIKRNGVQAITGQILNGVLTGMVNALGKGYTVAGAASPTTDPGTMTGPLAYIAYTAGTYTHFDNIVVEQGEVSMLIYNEAEWHKEVLFSLAAQATVDDNIGVPSVGVSFVDGILTFNFRNMKGEPGENGQDGDPAGFGTISASISGGVGTPGVSVQSSGPDTAKNIAFQFTNLKGETGVTSCVVTVDNTTGNPSCAVSLVGQELHLDFSGLKGAQGNTGSSVDYPFTIVNNLTTDDATQALSAAMGVQLESEVSQLEAEVHSLPRGKNYGFFPSSSDLPNDATEEGFAYVGATEPYEIWEFDGTTWTDSGVQANAFNANDEQVAEAVDDYLDEHPTVSGTFTNTAKRMLLSLLEKVAYIDGNGQSYIDALRVALNDVAINYIEAVFTQGDLKVYDGFGNLDDLKPNLVVTAHYVDGSTSEIFDYELSGALTAGTSTITVTVDGGFTDTFNVTVTPTLKLYMDGDECASVTGGWQAKGFNLTNASPSKTKETSDLLIMFASHVKSGGQAGTWSTTNKIAITGYTKIIVELERYNASGRGDVFAVAPASLSEGTTIAAAFGSNYNSYRTWLFTMGGAGSAYPSPANVSTSTRDLVKIDSEAYISIYINLYTDSTTSPSTYPTNGAYIKIKKVALAAE